MRRGKYLVFYRGHSKGNERGLASEFIVGTKEIEVKEANEIQLKLSVHQGLNAEVIIGKHELDFNEVGLLLWAEWEGTKILMGGGRWVKKNPGSSKLYVPRPGKYTVEILIPEGQKEERYKNGTAYWGGNIKIEKETQSVRISINDDTKHDFRGLFVPPKN